MAPTKTRQAPRKKTAAAPQSKRHEQRSISADALRALCALKSDERLDAQRILNKASDAFFKKAQEEDKRHKDAAEAYEQAEADATAHEDYLKPGGPVQRGEITRKQYDADHRHLLDVVAAKKKARDDSRQQAQQALAPFRKALDDANKHVSDLARQWKFHEKRAHEADVDISDLWDPSKPLPPEDEDAEGGEA